jgi:hypothetical protein
MKKNLIFDLKNNILRDDKLKGKRVQTKDNFIEVFMKFRNFLDSNGLPIITSARDYLSLGNNNLSLFMMATSTYVLPTEELIDTLDTIIGVDSNAIEICCGNGVIGRELNMPITDSKIQQKDPEIRRRYIESGNMPVNYPDDVEELEALEAVEKYKPDTVLVCYGTHLWKPGMTTGFIYGVDYEKLWKKTKRIILVGSDAIHHENPLMKIKHKEISKWGLMSRNKQTKIYIWEKL